MTAQVGSDHAVAAFCESGADTVPVLMISKQTMDQERGAVASTPFVHVQFHSLSSIVSYYAGVFAGIFRPFKRLRDELFYVFLELARRKCTKRNTEIRRQHRP